MLPRAAVSYYCLFLCAHLKVESSLTTIVSIDVREEDNHVRPDHDEEQFRPGDMDLARVCSSPIHVKPIQSEKQQADCNEPDVAPKQYRKQLDRKH